SRGEVSEKLNGRMAFLSHFHLIHVLFPERFCGPPLKVMAVRIVSHWMCLAQALSIASAEPGTNPNTVKVPIAPALRTRWAAQVSSLHPHPEYPRPQLVRPEWLNLNGQWDYAIWPLASGRPDAYHGNILVPFPIESALSGVTKQLD